SRETACAAHPSKSSPPPGEAFLPVSPSTNRAPTSGPWPTVQPDRTDAVKSARLNGPRFALASARLLGNLEHFPNRPICPGGGMADTPDLGSGAERRESSSLSLGTAT